MYMDEGGRERERERARVMGEGGPCVGSKKATAIFFKKKKNPTAETRLCMLICVYYTITYHQTLIQPSRRRQSLS